MPAKACLGIQGEGRGAGEGQALCGPGSVSLGYSSRTKRRHRFRSDDVRSINQSKRKTSNANGQTNLGHKHKAPDHNHEATQPMVDLPHTS